MYILLTVLHIFVALALVLVVLLQTGKGASIGAVFGGASQTLFGPRGAGTFLSKLTTIAAIIFMITSLSLAILSGKRETASVITETVPKTEPVIPSAPSPLPTTQEGEQPSIPAPSAIPTEEQSSIPAPSATPTEEQPSAVAPSPSEPIEIE